MRKLLVLTSSLLLASSTLWADKIIMKDGKIYEGRVMGETPTSVLISNPPFDPKPRFIELSDVLTIVRESRPTNEVPTDDRRFASMHIGTRLQVFSSKEFSFAPAPGLYLGGAFRLHPVIDLEAEMHFTPHLSRGGLIVTNGTTARGYEDFYAYQGGFATKLFPFFKRTTWRAEPYVTTGYRWSRLVPKASGDILKGHTFFGGAGALIPWWKPLYWDFRMGYEHTQFRKIEFLTDEGTISGVSLNALVLSAGLSWRFR